MAENSGALNECRTTMIGSVLPVARGSETKAQAADQAAMSTRKDRRHYRACRAYYQRCTPEEALIRWRIIMRRVIALDPQKSDQRREHHMA